MTNTSPLPTVEIRLPYGAVNDWSITVDGRPLRKVRSISLRADAVSKIPVVTIEMVAEVVFVGETRVDLEQVRHIAHCDRPHADEVPIHPEAVRA